MYLRPNFLLAAAAWRTRCLVSRELRSDVYTRRIILVVWDGRVRTDRRVVHGRYVSVGGTRRCETFESVRTSVDAVSMFQPGRRWPLVSIATYAVVTSLSVNRKWHHHSSPNRATLTTGAHRIEPFRHRRSGTLIRQLAKSRNWWYANCRRHCFDC